MMPCTSPRAADATAPPATLIAPLEPGLASVLHPDKPGRNADIEALRGVAILMVLAFHIFATLAPWPIATLDHVTRFYVNFWGGVDIFFGISGFVITGPLLRSLSDCRSPAERFRAMQMFWTRRVFRLLPAAWFWLGVILLCAAFLNRSGQWGTFHANWESTFAGLLSVANIRFAHAFLHYNYGASAPYWSLSLEEQFYICLPFVIVISGRYLPHAIAGLLLGVAILPETPLLNCFRVQAMLLGVLLALLSVTPYHQKLEPGFLARHPWLRRSLVGLDLLTIAALAPPEQGIVPHRFDFVAVLAAGLVFLASFDKAYLCADGAAKRVLVWIGGRSYSLYLTHLPAITLAHEVSFRLRLQQQPAHHLGWTLAVACAGMTISFACAECTYRVIEVPMRDKGKAIAGRLLGHAERNWLAVAT